MATAWVDGRTRLMAARAALASFATDTGIVGDPAELLGELLAGLRAVAGEATPGAPEALWAEAVAIMRRIEEEGA